VFYCVLAVILYQTSNMVTGDYQVIVIVGL